ncbi:MAG: nucleotidyltransferase family protein [Bacilli bacterium]|nr:nucleotidyltransferase family protein [Bacilli bacterium]
MIKDLEKLLGNKNILYDIKNQARVHIWYNKKYNSNRKKYISCEDAISSWGATITCVGVRLDNNKMIIYCPYGLNDIFTMTVRPIKKYFTKEQYDARASRWKAKWNELNIIEW